MSGHLAEGMLRRNAEPSALVATNNRNPLRVVTPSFGAPGTTFGRLELESSLAALHALTQGGRGISEPTEAIFKKCRKPEAVRSVVTASMVPA
jgi:hypothetical protein